MKNRITKLEKIVGNGLVFILLFVVGVNVYITNYSKPYLYNSIEDVPQAQAALVLGAAVFTNGALTPVLQDRAITAIELYKAGKVSKILVSGDNSRFSHNEVVPVGKFMIKEGVREEDIFLDYAGFDTYDSMYRARDIFKVDSVVVITQNFHLPRSIYLARSMGMTAYGLSADRREYLLKNNIREYFATVKAFGNVFLGSKPKFLGESVPISGTRGNVPVAPATTTPIKEE